MLRNDEGITVKQLKEYLKNVKDVDSITGEDTEVWLDNGNGTSSPLITIRRLNRADIIFTSNNNPDYVKDEED
jgi:hypothetical protein